MDEQELPHPPCPLCGTPVNLVLVKGTDNEYDYYCTNKDCPAHE